MIAGVHHARSMARFGAIRRPDYLVISPATERERDVIDVSAASQITVTRVQEAVCAHFGLSMVDMRSDRRARKVSHPRQVAIFLCHELTEFSLPAIGRMFGGRDHSTVIHAIRAVTQRIEKHADTARAVSSLRGVLK